MVFRQVAAERHRPTQDANPRKHETHHQTKDVSSARQGRGDDKTASPARPVYLDYNAGAPLHPLALTTMRQSHIGNPSSVHRFGRQARRKLEAARSILASMMHVSAQEVVFLSGGTEANALVGASFLDKPVLVSAGEHDSVLAAFPHARHIRLTSSGQVSLIDLERKLQGTRISLVSVQAANNETGVIQPISEIARLARKFGARLHCDGVQALGKIPLSPFAREADFLSLSGHKLGAPPGTGALMVRADAELTPLLRGGGQEMKRRAGTENVPGLAAFAAVAQALEEERESMTIRIEQLRNNLEQRVRALAPDIWIAGEQVPRLPNTSCLGFSGTRAETMLIGLDLSGVAVSSGSACSSGKVSPSHVLRAMDWPASRAAGAIRVSLGWASCLNDVEAFMCALEVYLSRVASQEAPASAQTPPARAEQRP